MQTLDRYCDECGAANTREAEICFACSRPLNLAPENQEEQAFKQVTLSDPPTPQYVQITLSSDAKTTVQLVQAQPQPTTPLLHGRYQILDKVGTGGFGAVYKARDTQNNNRRVAIKAIELDTLSAAQAIEATDTFNRELTILSSLDHPHLPAIYEHFIDSTHWYLVMDFIDGEPLDEYLQQIQESSLPVKEVINIGLQLCDVLRYLHHIQPPIIFRDIKPANIMRTPGGRLYLIDFGIARRFKPGQTKDTTPLGSPGFAAPEQYGKAQTTTRSDIYGLGATLYFLLTGYDPANTPFHLPPIRQLCSNLPEPLANLITSMLALNPVDRPANIAEVQQVLSNYAPVTRRTAVLTPSFSTASPKRAAQAQPSKVKTFFKGLLSVALTGVIMTACTLTAHLMGTSAMPSPNFETTYSAPQQQTLQTFRMPYIGHLDSLNPFTTTDAQAGELENLLFARLVSLSPYATSIQAAIANSWSLSADRLSWTFHLNPQATFSNGSPISAFDVVASLDHALAEPSAPANCPFFGMIKDANRLQMDRHSSLLGDSFSVIDSQTITITTAQPTPYFISALTALCGSIVRDGDLRNLGDGAFSQNLARIYFSGTYSVANYTPKQNITLNYTANTIYETQDPSNQAPAQIVVQSYPDVASSYQAYQAGQLDMAPATTSMTINDSIVSNLHIGHLPTLHYYAMNYLAKPFDNIAIRQAFALALDKIELAHSNTSSYDLYPNGTPTNSLLGPWSNALDNSAGSFSTTLDGDPSSARQLLTQGLIQEKLTGTAQLPPITFAYQAGQPDLKAEVELAIQMWKTNLGIQVTPRPVSNIDHAIAATRGNASLQLWAADYAPPYPDLQAWISLPFSQESPLNAVNYGQNHSPDAQNQKALQASLKKEDTWHTGDGDQERMQVYESAEQQLVNEVAWLPLYMVTKAYFLAPGLIPAPFTTAWSPWTSRDYCADIFDC